MRIETLDKRLNNSFLVIFIYSLVVLIVFSPILQETAIMKWDMINYFLPYRYFVGFALQNGELALWNPYVKLGIPVLGDPQSASWYPVTWIFGYFWGYNYTVIGFRISFTFDYCRIWIL